MFLSLCFVGLPAALSAQITVNFDLGLNQSHDGGETYTGLNQAEAGLGNSFVIGFQVTINNVGGTPVNIGPLAAFCSELAEPISATEYTFNLGPLSGLAAGTAGQSGTASSNIPSGGIGALRAARVAYLFDQYYISDQLTVWTQTELEPTLHAFQLALWELTHDTDFSLSNTSGSIHLPTQNNTLRDNAVSLAQVWLDEVNAAEVTIEYVSEKFDFYALTSATGNGSGGWQDLVLAVNKEVAIPEPRLAVLAVGLVAFGVAIRCRRRVR